jgi:hypothetical protein
MEIRIPISRRNSLGLLLTALSALMRGQAELRFKADEVNGKKRPVIFSREEVVDMQQGHMEAAANAQMLRELVEDAIANCPPELVDDPIVAQLKDSLAAVDKRVVH